MSTRTVFLVRKLVVYGATEGVFDESPVLSDTIPGCNGVRRWQPVAAFPTRVEAEAEAAARNRRLADTLNPIWMSGVHGTAAPPPLPDPAAYGVSVPPPAKVQSEYGEYETTENIARWYDERVSDWPAEVRQAVWQRLAPNADLFDVVEIGLDE